MKNKLLLDSGLWLDLYELAMAQVYFKYKRNNQASFELFIRSKKRPFYVACGVGECLQYLSKLRFTGQDIEYLRSLELFTNDFLRYLQRFKFQGEVWAVDEPEIIFAQEPILRITANLIEAQIVESALLNIINLNTTLATKAKRVVLAAKARKVYDFSLRRTQGKDASLAAARASFIAGAEGTSNVLAGMLFNIPVVGTMAHSYVMSFSSELDSFSAFCEVYPRKTILLIDTYDMKEGLYNAIRVALELRKEKRTLLGLRIDSGDLLEVSRMIRKQLDAQDLIDVIIFASGNLDEYKIKELVKKNAPIDAFGVGTHMGVSSDISFSDVIYKLVEVSDTRGEFMPVMKFSQDKLTLPSRKQVFRKSSSKGKMKHDVLGFCVEKGQGKPLLKKVMHKGQILEKIQDAFTCRNKLKKKIEGLPLELKDIDSNFEYPLIISNKLSKSTQVMKSLIQKRSQKKNILFFDVDTQFDFVDKKGTLFVKDADKLKSVWAKLTKFALKNDIKIISSLDTHKRGDPEFKEFPAHCLRASFGHQKIPQCLAPSRIVIESKENSVEELYSIKENYSQIILEKNVLDVFSNPNLQKLIKILNPEEVYVYGVTTEYCVRYACLGLKNLLGKVYVVEDAIKAITSSAEEKVLAEFKKKGIQFIKSSQMFEAIGKDE